MRQHPLVPGVRVWATNRVDSIYVLAVELGKWVPGCRACMLSCYIQSQFLAMPSEGGLDVELSCYVTFPTYLHGEWRLTIQFWELPSEGSQRMDLGRKLPIIPFLQTTLQSVLYNPQHQYWTLRTEGRMVVLYRTFPPQHCHQFSATLVLFIADRRRISGRNHL